MKKANKKVIILSLLLSLFAGARSLAQENIEMHIQEIKTECEKINKDTAKLKTEERDIFGHSSEGGQLLSFYREKELRKAILNLFGETGKSSIEYYLLNGELICVSKTIVRYKAAIYMGKVEIRSREENRFYFKSEKLIRWIDHEGKIVEANLYAKKEKELLDSFKIVQ